MAKISIKFEKIPHFEGIIHVREHFFSFVGPVIDKVLGLRCTHSVIKARDCGFFVKCLLLWQRLCGGCDELFDAPRFIPLFAHATLTQFSGESLS